MVLKLGLKLYEPRLADNILEDIGRLEGVKSAKWQIE